MTVTVTVVMSWLVTGVPTMSMPVFGVKATSEFDVKSPCSTTVWLFTPGTICGGVTELSVGDSNAASVGGATETPRATRKSALINATRRLLMAREGIGATR